MSKEAKIKAEIEEYKALLDDSTVPQDEKDFAKEEIKDLEAQLSKLGKKEPKKSAPKKAKKAPKKAKKVKAAKTPKPKKEKMVGTYKGKKLTDLDEKECDELLADIRTRREKATKSSAKSKSKPVVEKVAANVATAVKQAIDNVPAADIDKAKIEKFKKLEVAAKHFMDEMKSILGEDFDKESVKDEFKQITDLIEALRKKYTK
ncbi:MAG TPA: hypothetical protein PK289_09460 [Bacteroidia bacterium]|nr:hypothetical protein [Bacteroidia bacterium]